MGLGVLRKGILKISAILEMHSFYSLPVFNTNPMALEPSFINSFKNLQLMPGLIGKIV